MVINATKNRIAFRMNGYFVIKNFLDMRQQTDLYNYYSGLNLFADTSVSSYGVYTNNAKETDADRSKGIDSFIQSVCLPSIQKHFSNFHVGGGLFLLKAPGDKIVPMHQDWNIVDETTSSSFSVWCPLVDVDEDNGCLHVIPGSHNWFNNIRSSNMDSVFVPLQKVEKALVSLPLKKGDAVIFSHKLFHGSYPNKTKTTRPAICLSIMPASSRHVHYLRDGNAVKVVDAGAGFHTGQLSTDQNEHEVISTMPYKDAYLLTEEAFWAKYKQLSFKRAFAKMLHYISI